VQIQISSQIVNVYELLPLLLLLLVRGLPLSACNVCLVLLTLAFAGGGGVNQLSNAGTPGAYNRIVNFLSGLIISRTYKEQKME
jgi:hypothetical protein